MKNVFTLIAFSLFAISAIAQDSFQPTQRGNFVIGTRLGFSTAKSTIDVTTDTGNIKGDGGSSVQLNVSPALGYFLFNNFVIGVGMDWLRTSSKTGVDVSGGTAPPQESSNSNVLFGPFVRYFFPIGNNQAFFIGSTLGFGNSKNQYTGSDNVVQSINTSLLTLGLGPGFTIYSNNGLALETLVKYNYAQSDSDIDIQGVKRTSQAWTHAIDFSVGLHYYFGGFKKASSSN